MIRFPLQSDAFRGHGLSLLDEQARLRGLPLMQFPLESPPFTPINYKFIMRKQIIITVYYYRMSLQKKTHFSPLIFIRDLLDINKKGSCP
jgi:hypothetical protein